MAAPLSTSTIKRTRGDQGEAEKFTAQEQVLIDQYNAAAQVSGPFAGVRFGRIIAPKQVDLEFSDEQSIT